ncbi:MAG TPA: hypothetical protein VFA94_12495 [Acidimicrobiales bacterium]|nr:hypothetical protein [Acidimicrobiales bacterium]
MACGSQPSAVEQVARQRSAQAAQAARDAQLPKDVQDFLARAAGAAGHRYTVTYAGPGNGKTVLTQRPPDRRIDVVAVDGSESFVHTGGTTYTCTQPPQGAWTCEKRASVEDPDLSLFTVESLGQTINALAASRHQFRFAVTTRKLAGTTATCLVTTPLAGGQAGELCIAGNGAVLLIDTPQRQLTAVRYSSGAAPVRTPA